MSNLMVLPWMIGDGAVVDKWVVVGGNGGGSVLKMWWVYKLWSMVVSYYCCGSIADLMLSANKDDRCLCSLDFYLEDIIEAIRKIHSYTVLLSFEEFCGDERTADFASPAAVLTAG